mgnify:CR=1 FL=1
MRVCVNLVIYNTYIYEKKNKNITGSIIFN